MKGEIISNEFKHMVWVSDKAGKEYACRTEVLKNINRKEDLTEAEQHNCMDLSLVPGDSW